MQKGCRMRRREIARFNTFGSAKCQNWRIPPFRKVRGVGKRERGGERPHLNYFISFLSGVCLMRLMRISPAKKIGRGEITVGDRGLTAKSKNQKKILRGEKKSASPLPVFFLFISHFSRGSRVSLPPQFASIHDSRNVFLRSFSRISRSRLMG